MGGGAWGTAYLHDGCGSQQTGSSNSSLRSPSTSFHWSRLGTRISARLGKYLPLAQTTPTMATTDCWSSPRRSLPSSRPASPRCSSPWRRGGKTGNCRHFPQTLWQASSPPTPHTPSPATKQPVSCTRVLVSLGEGKIVGTDVRRQKSRLTSPVCAAVTRSLQPAG